MSAAIDPKPADLDQALRLLDGNGLSRPLLATILGIPTSTLDAVATRDFADLSSVEHERIVTFCTILIRLEIRFNHDRHAIRRALATPLACLGHQAPVDAMATGLGGLRAVHAAVGELTLPAERWFRVGHR